MREMIYDFKTHSIYYKNQSLSIPYFSLTIGTLEMIFELQTGRMLLMQGFLPLIQAVKTSINIPVCKRREYYLHNINLSLCKKNEVYTLINKIPQTKKYFEKLLIKYDEDKGIIRLGEEMKETETMIEVNENILCGLDQNFDLKCIYIIPTKFIKTF